MLLLQELERKESCIYYGMERENALAMGSEGTKAKRAGSLKEAVALAENLLFPIPFCKAGKLNLSRGEEVEVKDLCEYLQPGQRLFAGAVDQSLLESIRKKGVECLDYMQEERIALYNTIATAEGTIGEILQTFPYNLHGTRVLLLGYGRCAKVLAEKLKALGVRVSVYARREEALMEAYVHGASTIKTKEPAEQLRDFPIVINTIPDRIFTEKDLEKMDKRTRVYEIASYPYCMDPKAAEKKGIAFRICAGLPGKYSPASSAMILQEYIKKCSERKVYEF